MGSLRMVHSRIIDSTDPLEAFSAEVRDSPQPQRTATQPLRSSHRPFAAPSRKHKKSLPAVETRRRGPRHRSRSRSSRPSRPRFARRDLPVSQRIKRADARVCEFKIMEDRYIRKAACRLCGEGSLDALR